MEKIIFTKIGQFSKGNYARFLVWEKIYITIGRYGRIEEVEKNNLK